MWDGIARDVTTLFVIIDPIGLIPMFLAVTRTHTLAQRHRVAWRCILVAAIILIAFLLGGRFLLHRLDISVQSFQIAGGFVLFLIGLQMIFETEPKREPHSMEREQDVAVFPLAVPAIAGPGTMMALILLTDSDHDVGQLVNPFRTGIILMIILGITYLALRSATSIQRMIGDTGANVVSRLMGLILAALAVETVLKGLKAFMQAGNGG